MPQTKTARPKSRVPIILEVNDFNIGCTLNFVSQLLGYDFLSL